MLWLIVILSAYFLLALVNLVDKYILKSRVTNPKVYTFYVGILGISGLVLVPFGFLKVPSADIIGLAILAGIFHTIAVWILFEGLKRYEASRIVPAEGALLPIFTFSFTILTGQAGTILRLNDIIAFIFLVAGTVLITYEGSRLLHKKSITIALLSSI